MSHMQLASHPLLPGCIPRSFCVHRDGKVLLEIADADPLAYARWCSGTDTDTNMHVREW